LHGVETGHSERLGPGHSPGAFLRDQVAATSVLATLYKGSFAKPIALVSGLPSGVFG